MRRHLATLTDMNLNRFFMAGIIAFAIYGGYHIVTADAPQAQPGHMKGWKPKRQHVKPAQPGRDALIATVIGVARSAWPNSPCRNREVVTWNETQLRATYPKNKANYYVAAMAIVSDNSCRVVLGDFAWDGSVSDFCDLVTHELGHLNGYYGHVAEKAFPTSDPMNTLTPVPGKWDRCDYVQRLTPITEATQ